MTTHADIGPMLLRAARDAARLDIEEERALIALYRDGDQAAFGRLIIANVRLAISHAFKLRGYGLPIEDLTQEGIVGLLEAASRFDVDRGVPFSGYASIWVKASETDYVLRNWSIVKNGMTTEQKALFFRLRRMKAQLERDPSNDPSTIRAAIAAAMGVTVRDVVGMEARMTGDISLNAPAPWDEDGEAEIGDNLTASDTLLDDFAVGMIDADRRETAMLAALGELDDKERLIIQERWLTDDVAPLEALAEYLDISARTVKRIEIAAIGKLQLAAARQQMHAAAA